MASPDATDQESGRFRSILKSTSVIGGASALNILIAMVRVKIVALLLGPVGVGLLAAYTQVTALVSTVTGMGLDGSGVRQVAAAVATRDERLIARTVVALRRAALVTGTAGMLAMIVLSAPLSRLTFGDRRHALPIALLGVTALLGAISAGQSCLLRGTRRIADAARVTVLASLNSTLVAIPCYVAWGIDGVVVALILASCAGLATSWWFARRVPVLPLATTWAESGRHARSLLSLGVSFMGAGLLATGTTYFVQALLIRRFGVSGAGVYQAAFSLSGALVGFVLGALGADYYPRLTAVAHEDATVHRTVNEQAQVSTLLALPGLAAMIVLSPLLIRVFYAEEFVAAVPVLRWCALGILGRIFSWPLAFVMPARGLGRLFLATEAFASVVHVAAVVAFTRVWGIPGAAIALIALYVVYTGLMLVVMKRLVGAAWTRSTLRLNAAAAAVLVLLVLNASLNDDARLRWMVGIGVTVGAAWFCLHHLMRRSDLGAVRLLARIRTPR